MHHPHIYTSASRFTDTHVLYHVTSVQCSLAGKASPSTWDLLLGPQTLRCWITDLQTMAKEAKSFHMLASRFTCAQRWTIYLQTILGRESRVLPFTSASRFTDTLYRCWTIWPQDKFMAEEAESFQFTSASRFTDTCTGVEPFHLRTNSAGRGSRVLSVYISLLDTDTLISNLFYLWAIHGRGSGVLLCYICL